MGFQIRQAEIPSAVVARIAAKENGVAFLDLFNPSLRLYSTSNIPLTLNGIHLHEDVNRMIGEVIAKGFEGDLFADEKKFPVLANPVQLQVDGKGRLRAATWATYPKWKPLKKMNDALLIFEDDNNDGVSDRVKEFAKAGDDPFICSFAGHATIMRGVLHVK